MRKGFLLLVVPVVGLAGCKIVPDGPHVGFEFKIHRPALIRAEVPNVVEDRAGIERIRPLLGALSALAAEEEAAAFESRGLLRRGRLGVPYEGRAFGLPFLPDEEVETRERRSFRAPEIRWGNGAPRYMPRAIECEDTAVLEAELHRRRQLLRKQLPVPNECKP